ncbi:MAG: hypothetical protein AAGI68_00095 [Planctomycetota bacterium]
MQTPAETESLATSSEAHAQSTRAKRFLRYVVDCADNPSDTSWGLYRGFDGYALAAYALGDEAVGDRLLGDALAMMMQNFADERADPTYKWHLADFGVHPLLRAFWQFGPGKQAPGARPDRLPEPWAGLIRLAFDFPLHFGDLSENHNLLHLTLRLLLGQAWPDQPLCDGRTARDHAEEAGGGILQWLDTWEHQGSAEWGSGIYYNVNYLALFNLIDFAADPELQRRAKRVMDLFLLDQALHGFAGASLAAAHRDYAVYRMDAFESPSRPIHYILFGVDRPPMFNLNFIGGAIQAACSGYRPPDEVVRIARDGLPHRTTITHTVPSGLWRDPRFDGPQGEVDRAALQSHACRLDHALLGAMVSYPSRGRYTEFALHVTLGERAISFINQPSADPAHRLVDPAGLVELYDTETHPAVAFSRPDRPWFWQYANVPPGNDGDMRPGYWQGNIDGPRSFGLGRVGACLYDLQPEVSIPFVHVFCDRDAYDDVFQDGPWLMLRHGDGYAAWWFSHPVTWVDQGVWANREVRMHAQRCAALAVVGDRATNGGFASFCDGLARLAVTWEKEAHSLFWRDPDCWDRVTLSFEYGASINGGPINPGSELSRGSRWSSTLPAVDAVVGRETSC